MLVGLLGSGKSTTVKYCQMVHVKERWEAERRPWRAVVLLNTVQSIIHLFEFIKEGFTDDAFAVEGGNPDHDLISSEAEAGRASGPERTAEDTNISQQDVTRSRDITSWNIVKWRICCGTPSSPFFIHLRRI
ncbi:hypothetical protein CPB84DRAFT_1493298 [Gymnopilus junonius]|uniref:Uncharacterized protein n=1 Tax=Gymnopilus junonius TaxID=109634 RepID=A0A9P5NJS0_GYMJU|nr:hypothetical protein CPB84DRAFT_1493298 [Gymnopilus junonius]